MVSVREESAAAIQRARERAQAGDLAGAAEICRALVSRGSSDFNALFMLGALESHFGNFKDAERHLSRATALDPQSPEALFSHGNVLLELNRPAEAADVLEKGLAIRPREVIGLIYRGLALVEMGKENEALVSFDRALLVNPHELNALHNRANILIKMGCYGEARQSVEALLRIAPDHVLAISNRASILMAEKNHAAALAETDRVLAIKSDCAAAHYHRGNVLKELKRYDEALECYDRVLAIQPDYVDAYLNRSELRISIGDFVGGWCDYLERERLVSTKIDQVPFPKDLLGCRMLVLSEQGLGDEIFFLRFAASLKERGATILYRASEKMSAMIARARDVDHVVNIDSLPFEPSVTVSLGDLPYLLGMSSVEEIPPPLVLPPLPEALNTMAARLRALGPAPYVGVTWRAGSKNGFYKEAPRAAMAKTLTDVPGTLVALQRLPQDGEVEAFALEVGHPVHDLTALNDSLEDMLAVLALIDDYVCVSNTNVHLRAGTGRPCRVLVPSPPEFRWMAEGGESPWFPGSSIYRQEPNGDWSAALAALKIDLS